MATHTPHPPLSPWLTIREAAGVMRLGRNRVYDLCASGRLPHRRVGRTIHIRRDVAETWTPDGGPVPLQAVRR